MQKKIFLIFIMSIILCSNNGFSQSLNGHEYVDLGLPSGTKWAKCNIGAKTEIDYGDYYAFAETAQKNEYTIDNYKVDKTIRAADSSYIDMDGFKHTIIGKDIFNIAGTEYDVATVKWGNGWCMPTREQFDELKDNCKWEWVSKNGVYGYKVTGKTNDKYIFLPAGGEQCDNDSLYIGSDGYYWTDLYSRSNNASYFHINSYYYGIKEKSRNNGLLVRPVYDSLQVDNLRTNLSVETQGVAFILSSNDVKGDTISDAYIKAKYEEQYLSEKYGDNYDDAQNRRYGDYIDRSPQGDKRLGWGGERSIGKRKVISQVFPYNNNHQTGTVKLEITVNEKGDVENVKVIQSNCSECTPLAIDAVKKWKYEPNIGRGMTKDVVSFIFN